MTRTVRFRTTAVAVMVVAVALVIASALFVLFLRRSLTSDVQAKAEGRAAVIAETVRSGDWDGTIAIDDDDVFVQIIGADGEVIASSMNASGFKFTPPRPGRIRHIEAPFDDDPFLVVAYGVEITGPTEFYRVVVGHTLDTVVETTAAALGLLALGIPVLLAFVAYVTWRVVGRALAPVEAIRAEVHEISGADIDRRVPVPSTGDEIARLAATMNEMLERLDEAQARQKRFVSDASHELRSPVASIRQLAEVALKHPSSGSIQELAGGVLAENMRVQRLVEDLLLLSRMDEGATGTSSLVDLDDVVFEEVDRVRQNGAASVDATQVSAGRVRGDRKSLARLVGNLLENASRHARGEVDVALFEEDGAVVLRVDDDGAGIPAAERARVFERFVRLEKARDRDSGGSGLGLAIVAEVAAHHGGRATVFDAPGGGARLEVRLPRAQ